MTLQPDYSLLLCYAILTSALKFARIPVGLRICEVLWEVRSVALTKRVELLLDPEQYARLERIARARGESVGALIRQAVAREYLQPLQEQKRAALRRLLQQEIDFGSWERAKKDIGREVVKELEAS